MTKVKLLTYIGGLETELYKSQDNGKAQEWAEKYATKNWAKWEWRISSVGKKYIANSMTGDCLIIK